MMNRYTFLGTMLFLICFTSNSQELTLDPSFGTGGIQHDDPFLYEDANHLALMPDGQIVYGCRVTDADGNRTVGIRMLENDGSPVTGFGDNGVIEIAVGDDWKGWPQVDVDVEGNIYMLAGVNSVDLFWNDFLLVKLDDSGNMDEGFGDNGMVVISSEMGHYQAFDLDVLADGSILTTGVQNDDIHIAKVTSTGSFDTDFGTEGIVHFDVNSIDSGNSDTEVESPAELKVDNQGKILVAGTSGVGFDENREYFMARLNSDGSLDENFDSDGVGVYGIGGIDLCSDFIELNDGSYVLVGVSGNEDQYFTAQKLLNDGSRDESFGDPLEEGNITVDDWTFAGPLRENEDGSLLCIVYRVDNPDRYPALLQLNASGQPDGSFGVDGIAESEGIGSMGIARMIVTEDWSEVYAIGDSFDVDFAMAIARFSLDRSTHLPKTEQNRDLKIYPNPTSHIVNVTSSLLVDEGSGVRIVDALGKTVFENNSVQSGRLLIRLDGLNPGYYFLQVFTSHERITQKLLLQ